MSDEFPLEAVERMYEEAERELESAVDHGDIAQMKYWLGRKRALRDVLEKAGWGE